MEDILRFDSIWIAESLGQGDLKTGKRLYEDCLLPAAATNDKLHVFYDFITSADGLQEWLEKVAQEVSVRGRGPILHIEAHGDSYGLQLQDGSTIEWRALKKHLQVINRLMRFNLLVVMAACSGAHLARIVLPTEPSPVWGLVGPVTKVNAVEIEGGFTAFYQALLTESDGRMAVQALYDASPKAKGKFSFVNAEFLFRYAFFKYVELACDQLGVKHRSAVILSKLLSTHPELIRHKDQLLNDIKASLLDHSSYIESYRRHFFMVADVPENDMRYAVDLASCMVLREIEATIIS